MTDSNGYLTGDDGKQVITEKGRTRLDPYITDTTGPVYAFTGKMAPGMISAAMARLSRRAGDMRVTLLDEFIDREGKDEGLLRRVITGYGDDSVQQLTSIHFVVEGASNLLTKRLEWFRMASYLEQSTRYIPFDQVDTQGNFKYVVPDDLPAEFRAQYVQVMDEIFRTYSALAAELTQYVRAKSPQGEDPELGRLAAERASQFKLKRLRADEQNS